MLQNALNSLVSPDAVRLLYLAKGEVERIDDLVDRLARVGVIVLQRHDPPGNVQRERPEHMDVKGLGKSEEGGQRRR